MKRILIAGYYGFHNTGDEAILASMVADLRASVPDGEITVVSGDPAATSRDHRVPSVLFTDIPALLEAARDTDLIVLGGGGIFHDFWPFDPDALLSPEHGGLSFFSGVALLAALYGKPLAIWGVGVGPLDTENGRLFTRAAFRQASVATVRDADSREALARAGLDVSGIVVAADPAFRLASVRHPDAAGPRSGARLSVAIRNWEQDVRPEIWEAAVAGAIDLFLERHPGSEAVFFPFQDLPSGLLDDVAVAERVRAALRHRDRTRVEDATRSPEEKLAGIAGCDVLLGMRLHAVLFGVRSGIPTVPIVYDRKVANLVEDAGLSAFAIAPSSLEARGLADRLEKAFAESASVSATLVAAGQRLADRAGESVRLAAGLLERAPVERPLSDEMLSLMRRASIARARTAARAPATLPEAPSRAPEPWPAVPDARGLDVLCLPIIDWGFRFQRPQQLLSQFADDGHRVFSVRTAFLGLDRDPLLERRREGVFEISLAGETRFDIYSQTLGGENLEQALTGLEMLRERCAIVDAICLVQYPSWEPLARALSERYGWKIVYDCLDEHTGFGTHGEATSEEESRLVRESDLVVATSSRLTERLRGAGSDVRRLPNAADFDRFARLPDRAESPLAALPRPVVGYYGAISSWFDMEAVRVAARRHPDWSFVLIGDTRGSSPEALASLDGLANVHRPGEVPYEDLPSFAAAFDVCTIPFVRTPLTEATDPVKLYEYFSTGKPVVARRLPEIEPFADVLRLYETPSQFVEALEAAVAEPDAAGAARRREIARTNTWAHRYRDLISWISGLPDRKPGIGTQAQAASSGSSIDSSGAVTRLQESVAARSREIRRLNEQVASQAEGIAFLRAEVAGRDARIDELTRRTTELQTQIADGHGFVEALIAERQATVGALNAELDRVIVESNARRAYLEYANAELDRWERSVFGSMRRTARRIRRVPGALRRRLGRLTAPGTLPYEIGTRVLPRGLARWLRRAVAPVAQPQRFVEIPVTTSEAVHDTGGLPSVPAGKPDVVVLSIIDWDFRFQRPQQLATQFGRHGHRVFYLSTTRFGAPGGPAWQLTRKAPNVAELVVRTRLPLDIYGGRLEAEDLDALEEAFRRLAADLAMGDVVCLVQIPFWAPFALRMAREHGWTVGYDCMDEWTNFPGFGADVLALEEGLVHDADLTIVSADRLVEKWREKAPRLTLARNGIDAEHYRARYAENDLLGHPARPVIGYYGALASWVDVPLLEKIARRHSRGTIVLAGGHFDVDLSPLERLKNVRLLGQRPYDEMPLLLWNFDACVIPFLVNDITEATNPVKFYEYLYGGKPVVSPALTELLPFERFAYLARGHDDFLAQLDRALAEPADDPRRGERRRIAEENDWSHRYEAVEDGIRGTFPLVSIVVVSYGGLELTQACLDSVLGRETWPNLEVLVVDNASPDGTPEYLAALAASDVRVRAVFNADNRGFAAANNQGVVLARGEFVILLNNDTVVPPGMTGRLVRHLQRDSKLGILCPTTNFCGNEAKVDAGYAQMDDMPAFAARRADQFRGRVFDIAVAAMYCVALRRSVLDELGPLDEAYGVGMFEDDDFAIRARKAGYRVACAEDVYVHHVGQGSFRKLSPAEYEELWKKNQAYFEKKWGLRWKAHNLREGVAPLERGLGA